MRQRYLPSKRITQIENELIPREVDGLPEGSAYVDDFMQKLPAVVGVSDESGQISLPFDGGDTEQEYQSAPAYLSRPTPRHGRSFAVDGLGFPESWKDSFGNLFTSVSVKGNNFSNPTLIETLTAHEGVIAFGLQESLVIQRVLRASAVLRAAGVGTEYILAVAELERFPTIGEGPGGYDHTNRTLEQYRQYITHNYWRGLPAEQQTPQKLGELLTKLQKMSFFVTLRAMDTSYRLGELPFLPNEVLSGIYSTADQHLVEDENTKNFNSTQKADLDEITEIERFISSITIPRLAQNTARLHHLGLAHRFPVEQNISAYGSLIDLDSVHGASLELGDEPINVEDVTKDLYEIGMAINQTLADLYNNSFHLKYESKSLFKVFLIRYEIERLQLSQETGEITPNLVKVAACAHQKPIDKDACQNDADLQAAHSVLKTISDQLALNYETTYKDGIIRAMELWLAENEHTLVDQLKPRLAGMVSDFVDISYGVFSQSGQAEQKLSQPGFDLLDWTKSDGLANGGAIRYFWENTHFEIIKEFLDGYDLSLLGIAPDEHSLAAHQLSITLLKAGLIKGSVIEACEEAFFKDHQTYLKAALQPKEIDSIVPGASFENSYTFSEYGPYFSRETMEVPFIDFICHVTKSDRLDLNIYLAETDQEVIRPNHKVRIKCPVNDSRIKEVITDDEIDLRSRELSEDGNFYLIELHASARCSYIAVVKESKGAKDTLDIYLCPDTELREQLAGISQEALLEIILNNLVGQERLLDDEEMKRLLPRPFSLLNEIVAGMLDD